MSVPIVRAEAKSRAPSQTGNARGTAPPPQQQVDDRRLREPWRHTPAAMFEIEVGHQPVHGCRYDSSSPFARLSVRQSHHRRPTRTAGGRLRTCVLGIGLGFVGRARRAAPQLGRESIGRGLDVGPTLRP